MKKTIKMFSLMASIALAGVVSPALADTATPAATPAAPTVSVTGLVDAYYSFNFTNDANHVNGIGNGALYAFNSPDSDYVLGLAELSTKVTAGEATAVVDLMYGQTATSLLFANPTGGIGDLDLTQAYLTLTKADWTFTFGKFVTWMGNEVIQSNANWNYSRSVLFFGIPLYHMGFSVGVAPSSQFGITGYVVNGWNNSYANGAFVNGEKTFGLQVKINPAGSSLGIVLNGVYGPDPYGSPDLPTLVSEAIFTLTATDKLSFALDTQLGLQTPAAGDSLSYYGAALYGKLAMDQGWGLALRLEDVMNNGTDLLLSDGSSSSTAATYQEATLTLQNQLTPNVLARLEGRYDTNLLGGTAVNVYANGLATSQVTGTASMVFSF